MIPAPLNRTAFWLCLAVALGLGYPGPAPGSEEPPPLRQPSAKELAELKALHDQVENLLARHDWWPAEHRCLELLDRLKEFEGDRSPEMCRQRVRLARIYQGKGQLGTGRDLLVKQVDRLRGHDSAKHPDLDPIDFPQSLYILASIETDLNAPEASIRYVEEALNLLTERRLDGDELTAMVRRLRGVIRAGQGDYRFARADFAAALKSAEVWELPPGLFSATLNQCLAATWIAEAEYLREAGQLNDARQKLETANLHLVRAETWCRTFRNPSPQAAAFAEVVDLTREVLNSARATAHSPFKATVFGIPHILYPSSSRSGVETKALRLTFRAYSHVVSGQVREADEDLTQALALLRTAPVSPQSRVRIDCLLSQAVLRGAFLGRAEDAVRQAETALDELHALSDCPISPENALFSLQFLQPKPGLWDSH